MPEDHPRALWGVLLTSAADDEVIEVGRQIQDADGDLVVCYVRTPGRGSTPSAGVVRDLCHARGAGFVVLTTPQLWNSTVGADLRELLPAGTVVVSAPDREPPDLERALRTHAEQLCQFHGVRVTEEAVRAAMAPLADGLPDSRLVALPGQSLDPLLVGVARLNHWVMRRMIDGVGTPALAVNPGALAEQLKTIVVGQDDAIEALAGHLSIGAAGLRLRAERPRTAVLLTGPTGTGKTLLATALARELGVPLIRVDLASYTSRHQISTLLGSPPGYVGSTEDERWLTTRVAAAPNAVLLLDEFDKAAPELWGPLLMELLGAGTITDEQGTTVSCRGLHVLLTANTGSQDLTRTPAGFGDRDPGQRTEAAVAAVRRLLPDEVFNRLDDVLVMGPMDAAGVSRVLDIALRDVHDRLAGLGYEVRVSAGARRALLAEGWSVVDGARRLHRTLERLVVAPALHLPLGRYLAVRAGGGVQLRAERRDDH